MVSPHKGNKQPAIFCWLSPHSAQAHTILYFSKIQHCPSPRHINTTDCNYTHLYVCVLKVLTLWPVWWLYSTWSGLLFCKLITQWRCADRVVPRRCQSSASDTVGSGSVEPITKLMRSPETAGRWRQNSASTTIYNCSGEITRFEPKLRRSEA
jgi:hypothetical protein